MTRRESLLLASVLVTAAVISLRGIGDDSIGYPDADRILMDGVFLRDFALSLEWLRPFDFASRYFAQYPALSIGYRPPAYPMLIAFAQLFLGVSMWSARLVEIVLWLVAVVAWFRMLRRHWGEAVAATSSLLLVTTPFVAKFAWFTMAELPVLSWSLLAVAFWQRYLETDEGKWAILTSLMISSAVWTKQTAIVLVVWFVLEALIRGRWVLLKRREIWISLVLGVILLVPIAGMTLSLGNFNLQQSVGVVQEEAQVAALDELHFDPRTTPAHYTQIPRYLVRWHMTLPVIVLAGIGLIVSLVRRDTKSVFFAVSLVAIYGFFTAILAQDPRYTIVWIPSLTLFAALGLSGLTQSRKALEPLLPLVVVGLSLWQAVLVYREPLNRASGYDEAAAYVLEHSESVAVMFDGYNNGYFTYFMRAQDPGRSMWVLRGDKLLSSTALLETWNEAEIFAETEEDIEAILKRYGVHYVVVEKRDITQLEIHRLLRSYLERGPFALRREIPVEGERRYLEEQTILIYEYLEAGKPEVDQIELEVPLIGRSIVAPWPQAR